jgi:hypothetical protein
MDERIEVWQEDVIPGNSRPRTLEEEIRGEARYSNFKQFIVDVKSRVQVSPK